MISRWIDSGALVRARSLPGRALKAQFPALFGKDQFDAEWVAGNQLPADALFLVIAGFAVRDHHGQPVPRGFAGEGGKCFELLAEQRRSEMTKKGFDRLFVGERDLDEDGLEPAGLYKGAYRLPDPLHLVRMFNTVGAGIPEIQ